MNLQMGRRLFGLLGVLLVGLVSFVWGCAEGAPEEAQADVAVQSPDMDAMKATYQDGFLKIEIPRAPAGGRHVPITTP